MMLGAFKADHPVWPLLVQRVHRRHLLLAQAEVEHLHAPHNRHNRVGIPLISDFKS